MILATSIIGLIYRMGNDFDDYLKIELKKRKIPIEGKHVGLFMVLFSNNNLKFKDIAHRWRKSKSTLCDILCKYSEQGLIEKVNCTLDKRHLYIKLTEEGFKYARDFNEIANEFLEKITSGLSESQKKELKAILIDMEDNLKKNKFEKNIS
jgi:DNA-binding MarR family transcriptional regulator